MKEISRIFYKIIFLFLLTFAVEVNGKILSEGNADARVTVKVFSSLTCPACLIFTQKSIMN